MKAHLIDTHLLVPRSSAKVKVKYQSHVSQKMGVSGALVFHKHILLFNPFPNKPWFLRVCSAGLLKTLWEKEKLLVTSNFSFSHSVFYPSRELSTMFINFKIVVCKLFHIGKSLKFVVWERAI